ncbi:MAG: tryptophan-rich sensory protein [Bacteroidetes bacterium]|nr:tryptophan-rich sensory protein [Bacteroidota bacterium]
MNKYLKLIGCVLLTLSVGGVSGLATASGINNWFMELNKPFFNPPNYLFGPVWTLLYCLMGISLFLILQSPLKELKRKAIFIFAIQLSLNFLWSFIFFKFQLIGLAFLEIILIWISILAMIINFYKIDRIAAGLQIPYLLWVSFASVLNGAIFWLN